VNRFSVFTDEELKVLFEYGILKDECGYPYTPQPDAEPDYLLSRELYEEALARGLISPYDVDRWNFKVSDTPPGGPEEISGHPATAGPHNNKEIA
jgi:hypothetical protein